MGIVSAQVSDVHFTITMLNAARSASRALPLGVGWDASNGPMGEMRDDPDSMGRMTKKLTGWQRFWVLFTVIWILVSLILIIHNFAGRYYSDTASGKNELNNMTKALLVSSITSALVDLIEALLIPVVGWGVYWVWRGIRGEKGK